MGKLIDADKLKQHYSWWPEEDRALFDTIVDLQPAVEMICPNCGAKIGQKASAEVMEVKDGVVISVNKND